jgi:SRSO17 transposase
VAMHTHVERMGMGAVRAAYDEQWHSRSTSSDVSEIVERLGKHFSRAEPRERAISYITGLLSDIPRKNGCNLAVHANEVAPDGMHRLLTTAKWDVDGVRDELRRYVLERFGRVEAVLTVGQTDFAKRGDHSAGVERQYSETSRRMENCQVGMFLGYLTPSGIAFIDRELYLPQKWMSDAKRQVGAGIPGRAFGSRSELACRMLRRAFSNGVPKSWVVASDFDDADGGIRKWLEDGQIPHIVEIRPSAHLNAQMGPRPTEICAEGFLSQVAIRRMRGLQTSEARWFRLPLGINVHTDTTRWLVIRRCSDGKHVTYYHASARTSTPLLELVRKASTCLTVNCELARAKSRVGLDQYEARRYEAWYRHITLALFAHALLSREGAHGRGRIPAWT